MSILVSSHARIAVQPKTSFQSIREVVAKSPPSLRSKSTTQQRLCSSYLHCQKGMKDQPARDCLRCPRLVNFVPHGKSLLVRCLWTESDRVEDLMTLENELLAVAPWTTVSDADDTARENGVRHLLVVDHHRLYGVLCRCDLVEEAGDRNTVAERANHCPWTISPEMTLAQAAHIMREKQIGMLPVVANGEVVGVVTRGDLRRAGLAETLLGGESCASCHSASGVFAHPAYENVNVCLDCLESSQERLDYAELGG